MYSLQVLFHHIFLNLNFSTSIENFCLGITSQKYTPFLHYHSSIETDTCDTPAAPFGITAQQWAFYTTYDKDLEIDPKDVTALVVKGFAFQEFRRYDEAKLSI
jgi:hypothetical protein